MLKIEGHFADRLFAVEREIFQRATKDQASVLEFFRLVQDNLWSLLENQKKTVGIPMQFQGARLITYQLAVRMLTMSQVAMRSTLSGYSEEALALSRTISEATRVNVYLCFHEEEIPNYMSGKLKVQQILKREKNLHKDHKDNPQSRLWGYLSDFAHATPEFFTQFARQQGQRHIVQVLVANPEGIDDVCHGINSLFFSYYSWFRLIFRGLINIPAEVIITDEKLFNSDLPRQVFNTVADKLPEMHKLLYPE